MQGRIPLLCWAPAVGLTLLAACAHHQSTTHAVAGTPVAETGASADRIQDGFMRLGASESRSACFANVLAERLEPDARAEAEGVLESASSKDEMRAGVMSARLEVRQAFIAANMRCPRTS